MSKCPYCDKPEGDDYTAHDPEGHCWATYRDESCSACADAWLLRRGVDLAQGGSQYAYGRVGGVLRRKRAGR